MFFPQVIDARGDARSDGKDTTDFKIQLLFATRIEALVLTSHSIAIGSIVDWYQPRHPFDNRRRPPALVVFNPENIALDLVWNIVNHSCCNNGFRRGSETIVRNLFGTNSLDDFAMLQPVQDVALIVCLNFVLGDKRIDWQPIAISIALGDGFILIGFGSHDDVFRRRHLFPAIGFSRSHSLDSQFILAFSERLKYFSSLLTFFFDASRPSHPVGTEQEQRRS